MYEAHFGFRERPFRATPDTACYYPATSPEHALARLLQALRDDEGMVLLSGEPGTGKTLLCHCLLERLGSDVTSAFLTNSHVGDATGLLQAILYDLALPYEKRSEQELRLALTDFLLQTYAAGRRSVLVMDEAQYLKPELLEELRLLANLESARGRALQVVLAAQPAILETLRRPELAALAQRLAVRVRLAPLGPVEAADYLVHQVRQAGGRPESVLTDEALEMLARGSGGVPRLLNQATHQALSLACAAGSTVVDAEAVLEALELLGLVVDSAAEEVGAGSGTADSLGDAAASGSVMLALEEGGLNPEEGEACGEEQGSSCRLFPAPRRPA
jgi:general secretion pathway protein A